MKLEQQVCSLELAKKLKELGVKQESLYSFMLPLATGFSSKEKITDGSYILGEIKEWGIIHLEDYISAFTVAELGEMLPIYAQGKYQKLPSPSGKDVNSSKVPITPEEIEWLWQVTLLNGNPVSGYADTEADARAKMLVYLLENKLITL